MSQTSEQAVILKLIQELPEEFVLQVGNSDNLNANMAANKNIINIAKFLVPANIQAQLLQGAPVVMQWQTEEYYKKDKAELAKIILSELLK